MLDFNYDSFDLLRTPKVSIHRLDLEMLGYLDVSNLVIKPTFFNVSEVSFVCNKDSNLYDCVRKDMVLEISNFNRGYGRFVITNVTEDSDGQNTSKNVEAQSYEVTMNRVTLSYKDNTTFKLWDAVHPDKGIQIKENGEVITSSDGTTSIVYHEYPTLLYIIQQQTGWTVTHVDSDLLNEWRTLTIDKEQAYGLLMGDIAEAFKCYFEFDTQKKEIMCYTRNEEKRPIKNTGINISFRNLINTQKISEGSEEVITALTVEGAEGVGINIVNPLGNNVIYDFSYYMGHEPWSMPWDLQVKVKAWLDKIDDSRERYANIVQHIREENAQLVELDGKLSVAESELKALQDVQSVDIAAGNNEGLEKVYPKIREAEGEVAYFNMEIKASKHRLEKWETNRATIISSLSFEANFTDEEYEKLTYYINGSVYENANFVYTNTMTEERKIEISQQLYEQGLKAMAKLSKALYQYECDISPFFMTTEYEEFTRSIIMGGGVNLELQDFTWVTPRLMQLILDFDNPENCKMILSDSFRMANSVYQFSDGYTQAIKASRKTSLAASKWDEPSDNGFYAKVGDYINNALNLANQEIVNADNQEFTLGSYGLRGKKYDEETDTYDPHQVAMTNNVLAFTDDNWQSCKTALGKIKIGEEGKEVEYYGLVAEAIFGNILAGEQLTIESKDGSFVVDGSGARLKNAPMTIENDVTKIVLNPDDGFQIQKKDGNVWKVVLSETDSGDIEANSIDVKTGKIGGWTIDEEGLTLPGKDQYIKSDGTGKLGLMRYTEKTAIFDGDIYANNLKWNYDGNSYNVFSSGAGGLYGGYLNGGWLGNGTVGKTKLEDVWVNSIEGVMADFKAIQADIVLTDALKAGYIETEEGRIDLLFGGKVHFGSVETDDKSEITGGQETISSEIGSKYSITLSAAGNVNLNPQFGAVKIGGNLQSTSLQCGDGTFNNIVKSEWMKCSSTLNTRKIFIGDGLDDQVDSDLRLKLEGTASLEWIRCPNRIDTGVLSISNKYADGSSPEISLNVNGTAYFDWIRNGNRIDTKDLDVSNESTFTGAVTFKNALKTDYYGTVYTGRSFTFWDKDGNQITVRNGLIV